jgi:hypothetical protein
MLYRLLPAEDTLDTEERQWVWDFVVLRKSEIYHLHHWRSDVDSSDSEDQDLNYLIHWL